jgi:hypothetical protein
VRVVMTNDGVLPALIEKPFILVVMSIMFAVALGFAVVVPRSVARSDDGQPQAR